MLDRRCTIFFGFLVSASLVSGEKAPEKIVVNQGQDVSMYCSTSNPFGFCEWKMQSKGTTCNIAMDSTNSGTCKNAPRARWQTNSTHCGITLNKVSRLESDTYSCKLFTSENIFENRAYELDVASRAKVSLLQESFPLSSDEDLIVDSKSVVEFECEASHGFPPPTVAAFIGMLDSNSGEVISPSKNSTVKNQDGTFGIKVAYSFVAKPEHCGLYLKCVSMQPGSNSLDVFAQNGPNEEAIKIEVNYPPQPLANQLLPFKFTPGSEKLIISIEFMSSPQPQDNQAVWYISQTADSGMPYLPIQSGGKQSRYFAQTLTSSGHHTTAVLEINKPSIVDEGSNSYLEITTNSGSQKYYFEVQQDDHIEEHKNPDDQTEEDEEKDDEEDREDAKRIYQTKIIVSIICVITVSAVIIVGIIWLKHKGKLCFPKKPEPRTTNEENQASLINQNGKENGTNLSV